MGTGRARGHASRDGASGTYLPVALWRAWSGPPASRARAVRYRIVAVAVIIENKQTAFFSQGFGALRPPAARCGCMCLCGVRSSRVWRGRPVKARQATLTSRHAVQSLRESASVGVRRCCFLSESVRKWSFASRLCHGEQTPTTRDG